ncbi:hypothetical protein J3362_08075 [Marinobacter sp. NFXS11]|uniref:hypothetical protein n=1 Tax=Marinobacter sp. NFXS11 TaxID=2818432 RepID=UPI0032E0250C
MNPEICASTPWQPTELVNTLLSRNARNVVWHWISQKQFLDIHSQPRSLFFQSSDDADFNSLINQVQPDLAAAVVFNELLRKDIVVKHDDGRLLLRRSAYVSGAAFVGLHDCRCNDAIKG